MPGHDENDDDYDGPEQRAHTRMEPWCHLDDRVHQLEREARRQSAELRHITTCLEGYKPFVEMLTKREQQRYELRQKLIEKGIGAAMLSVAGTFVAMLWYAAVNWLKANGH